MKFNLDVNKAKEADVKGAPVIDKTGAYIGEITLAKAIKTDKGSEGIELSFKADSGHVARFLTLYTKGQDGSEIFGINMVYALMTVLSLRTIESKEMKFIEYDFEQRKEVEKLGECFPVLCNRKVGLVLQREEYEIRKGKNAGTIGHKMNVYACFNAESKKTATEILNKISEAKMLDEILDNVKDKKLSKSQQYEAEQRADAKTDNFFDEVPPVNNGFDNFEFDPNMGF